MSSIRLFAHGSYRADIGFKITLGIGRRPRSFAQHVEAGRKAAIILRLHPLDRLVDITTHDEHLPHQPHGRPDRLPDKRFASTRNQALQAAFAVAEHRLAKHQAPRRAINEQAR